jgi:hypothetical protein
MPATAKKIVVKLSDENVVRDIKREAEIADRSVAGQIEHWVKIGQAVEALLGAAEVKLLKENLRTIIRQADAEGVKAKILSSVNRLMTSPNRESVRARILAHGGPVFQADPSHPGRVVRIMPDGTRTTGRIKEGSFIPATARSARSGR